MHRVLYLFFLMASCFAAAQNSPAPRLSQSSVSGQVVLEGAGTPLRKVSITLVPSEGSMVFSNPQGREPKTAVTDLDGRFQISGVQPGEYRVILERIGFLSANRRSRRYSPNLLSLTPGQEVQGLLFRMRQGGVIKGRLVDEDGDPAPDMNVSAMPISGRALDTDFTGTTNDLGEFRIAGLPEGKFLVVAQPQYEVLRFGANQNKQGKVYAATYFPGTLDQSQAVGVEVHAGDESAADFNLILSRTFTVKGKVFGIPPQARPTSIATQGSNQRSIVLERVDGLNLQSHGGSIGEDGTFEVANLTPGTYDARITFQPYNRIRVSPPIEVRDSDVIGVQLAVEPSVEVRGRFRMDNGQKIDWRQLQVVLDPEDRKHADSARAARVQQDGSFAAEDVQPGNYHIVVTSNSSALRDYILKEVNANGKDVGDSGFTVGNAAPFLDVVGSSNGSTIEGVVVDDTGKPVSDMQMVCVPDAARRNRHDLYQQVQTDQRGYFSLRGLNPGEYHVFALEDDAPDITDPDFVAAHEGQGETVTVDSGERKVVTIKLPSPPD